MNDLNTSQATDIEVLVSSPAENFPGREAGKSRKVFKLIIGLLALTGLVAIVLIAIAIFSAKEETAVSSTIDEVDAVEKIMEHAYGKYSAAKRGWTYVDEDGDTYLVSVVQQKKIEAVGKPDELYIVTGGTRIAKGTSTEDEKALRTVYGVFKVTARNDELHLNSRPINFGGIMQLTPERVKFIAFNQDHWGWILKHISEDSGVQVTINEVLIAGENEIHSAGQFESAYDNTKAVVAAHGNCEAANLAHTVWKGKPTRDNEAAALEEKASEVALSEAEPQRCSKYSIAFHTDPVTEKFFTALRLTLTGVKDGQPVEQNKWKIMFDQKSFTYVFPKGLEADLENLFRYD